MSKPTLLSLAQQYKASQSKKTLPGPEQSEHKERSAAQCNITTYHEGHPKHPLHGKEKSDLVQTYDEVTKSLTNPVTHTLPELDNLI